MLTEVVCWRLHLDVDTSPAGIALSLAQVVNVVLVLEGGCSILLVLENLGQDPFGLRRVGVGVVLDRHSSAMNGVELTFDVLASW